MADIDLYVSKTPSLDPVPIGQPLTYTITASNNGPDDTTTAELTDNLPPGVPLSDITITQGSYCYADGTITWDIGTLNAGDNATMTVTVLPQSEGTISNTATISSTNEEDEDQNPSNNTVTVPVTVSPAVDLILIKESCPKTTTVESPINYSLVVLNNGPSPASNVVVTDTLPNGIDTNPNSITVAPSQGTYSIAGNIVTINLGALDVNNRATIDIQVIPTTDGTFTNTAVVTSEDLDSNTNNNSDSATTFVVTAADVSIVKTASSQQVILGDNVTYTLLVKNQGPSTATNITVLDYLPPNVDLISVSQSQGTHDTSVDPLTFHIGSLSVNGSATIEIVVKPKLEGMYTNTAFVTALEEDSNESNNKSSVCVFVRKLVSTDISVEKSHCPEIIGLCTPITYTVTVKNNGPVSATGITLVDQLPPSVEILSVIPTQGRCCICRSSGCDAPHHYCNKHPNNQGNCNDDRCQEDTEICSKVNEVICQLGTLAVGAYATVKIKVKPKLLGEIKNTAIVTANEADLNTTNNEVTDTLVVLSTCEEIEYLINKVEELIATEEISETNGRVLISLLEDAKKAACCDKVREAKKYLNDFIHKLNFYIKKEYISEAEGCNLINIAWGIIEELDCCNTCNCEEGNGDDLNG